MKIAESIEKERKAKYKKKKIFLVELRFDFWYDFSIFLGV